MKPPSFQYHAPGSLPEALSLLSDYGDGAKILAGGQSLMPMLNFRLVAPAHLIDITRINDLCAAPLNSTELCIGAGVRQRALERSPEIKLAIPLLHQAISNIAHAQIRNRGTICGSLAHADPAAELPTTMVALGATMVVASSSGTRVVPAADFFRYHFTTDLGPAELLKEVRVPIPETGTVGAFLEIAHRQGDFALVGAAVWTLFDSNGAVADCRVVCSGVAPIPVRAARAEEAIVAGGISDEALRDAQYATSSSVNPTDDIHATAAYRQDVVGVLVRRCLESIRSQRGALNE
jgi:carbon-monoxide dehydrogenase medium subunit